LPPGRKRRGDVECYEENRFFTVTGAHVPDTPETIQDRTEALTEVYRDHLASDKSSKPSNDGKPGTHSSEEGSSSENGWTDSDTSPAAAALSDSELLSRARNAANGAKFNRLWRGNSSGYESHSEADLALCAMLAFWTGGDPHRIENLFSRSGLVRDKWRKRPGYRKRTIQNAIQNCSEFYRPPTSD
jgi:primase-polymerase (primpol)-like protein